MPIQENKKKGPPKGGADGPVATGLAEIPIRAGAFPGGSIADYVLPEGSTVEDALNAANLSALKDLDIRHNGKPQKDLKAKLKAGDSVLVYGKVRGN